MDLLNRVDSHGPNYMRTDNKINFDKIAKESHFKYIMYKYKM